jgi:hypothetical protein
MRPQELRRDDDFSADGVVTPATLVLLYRAGSRHGLELHSEIPLLVDMQEHALVNPRHHPIPASYANLQHAGARLTR